MVVRRFGCVIRVLMQWLTRGGAAPQRRFREEVSKSAVYIIPTVDSYGGGAPPQRRFREEVSKSAVYIIPTVDSYGGGAPPPTTVPGGGK
jgi:hypothetical protein